MSGKETIAPIEMSQLPEDIQEILQQRADALRDNFEPMQSHINQEDYFLGMILSMGDHVLSYPPQELVNLLDFVDNIRAGTSQITPEIIEKGAAELASMTMEEWIEVTGTNQEEWAYSMLSTMYSAIALGIVTPGPNVALYLISTSGDKTFVNVVHGPKVVKH